MNRRSFFSRMAGTLAAFAGSQVLVSTGAQAGQSGSRSTALQPCGVCGYSRADWFYEDGTHVVRQCQKCGMRTTVSTSMLDLLLAGGAIKRPPEQPLGTPSEAIEDHFSVYRAAYEEPVRRVPRERYEADVHLATCPDCSRSHNGQRLPWETAPILSSRALWTLPVGSIAIVGRGGRPVERIDPYFYDVSTDTFRKDVRVRLLAFIRCGRLDVPKGVDTVQRPDGNWIIRAWDAVDRHEPRTIITCPKCSHACGNIVDHKAGITLSCQYCGYVTKA